MRAEVEITPYRDGPYLVRGDFVLRAQDGAAIGVSHRTVALCRCGKSRIRPFCDGTHRLVKFRAPSQAEDPHEDPAATPHSAPSRRPDSPIAIAAMELRRAQAGLGHLRQALVAPADFPAHAAAESLLSAARADLEALRPLSVSPVRQASAKIAPCLCLLRGALSELSSLGGTPDGELGALVGRLQSVVELLERMP